MMNKHKRIRIIIVIILCIALVIGGVFLYRFIRYKNTVDSLTISAIDLAKIPDGQYTGEFDAYLVKAKVQVTVESSRITAIDLIEHQNGRGENASSIPDVIITEQRIDVDAVSGATSSSKVIMKAVENALVGASQ